MKSTCSGVIVSAAEIRSPSFSRSRASTTITSPPRLSAASAGSIPVVVIDRVPSVSISVANALSRKRGPTAGTPQFYAIAEAGGTGWVAEPAEVDSRVFCTLPPHPRPLSLEGHWSLHIVLSRVEGEEFGGQLFKLVKRIMFQQRHRRQQHPQASQQGRCGVWPTAFRQAAAETDQHILEFDCFRRLIGLQLPDDHTSHRRDEQTAGNGPSGLLQPLLKLQTVAFKQLEKTFNSPSPVVATGQNFSAAQ